MSADLGPATGSNAAAGCDGILLGRSLTARVTEMGFGALSRAAEIDDGIPVIDTSEGHCLTIAPTGAGKGRNVIIPTLLTYRGSAVVIDPKGENARVTARHRVAMGQRVVIVDPFRILTAFPAQFGQSLTGSVNPLDCLDADSSDYESECVAMANLLVGSLVGIEPFWHGNAVQLLAPIIAYICRYTPSDQRTLAGLVSYLSDTDLRYKMAVALDTIVASTDRFVVDGFAYYLGHEPDKVASSVRSTAMQRMAPFCGSQVAAATASTSFETQDFIEGKPMTIYLVIPPHKLDAYGPLLALLVSFFLNLIVRRTSAPPLPTLFVLDELAQLGAFPLLRPLVTLMRGYGVRTMMFLQDASQLRSMFPSDHATIINNC